MKWEIFFPLILKNQLQGLTKKTEFFLRTIITILWEEWLEKKQEMPEVEEVYQKVNNCKILQVWKNTKAVFGHDRDILFRCKEDVVQLVHFVHAETGMPQVSLCAFEDPLSLWALSVSLCTTWCFWQLHWDSAMDHENWLNSLQNSHRDRTDCPINLILGKCWYLHNMRLSPTTAFKTWCLNNVSLSEVISVPLQYPCPNNFLPSGFQIFC